MNLRILLPTIILIGSVVAGSAGERIVFSGRDGRRVSFQFEKKEILLPADLQGDAKKREDNNLVPAHFKVLTSRVTPNAVQRRAAPRRSDPKRDWIFRDPDKAAAARENEGVPEIFQDRSEDPTMADILNGEEVSREEQELTEEVERERENERRSDAPGYQSKYDSRQSLKYEIFQVGGKGGSWLQQLEQNTGVGRKLDSAFANARGLTGSPADRDRHKQSMTAFKQMLSNPFQNSAFGESTLASGGGLGARPGRGVKFNSNPGAPGRQKFDFSRPAGIPSAFDNANSSLTPVPDNNKFQTKPTPTIKKRSFELEIPKSRFR